MADTTKIVLERTYNVPLRKEFLKVPRYKRTKKAVTALRNFLKKHMKSEDIKIGKFLNMALWKHGIKNPPHHIKINVIKDDKGVVRAELVGKEIELEKKEVKKESVAERIGLKEKKKDDLKQTYKPQTAEEAVKESTQKSMKEEETAEKTPESTEGKTAEESKPEDKEPVAPEAPKKVPKAVKKPAAQEKPAKKASTKKKPTE